jgi:sRNA-binding regulator protein Hfq
MNGTTKQQGINLESPGLDWQIQGTGDFNQDGKTDILWRNQNGQVHVWLMNGTTKQQGINLESPGLDWQIQGTGDFNQDGKTDILWRHQGGQVHTWLINGTQVVGRVNLESPGLDWQIQGTGDFNQDGKTDILWRHQGGQVHTWLMNGTTKQQGINLESPGLDWQIQNGIKVVAPSGLMATSSYLAQLSNGSLIGKYSRDVDNAYGYQCWDLVADATGISGSSPYWIAGTWKRGVNVIGNGNVAVGTAIATFAGTNNSYYGTYNHTGIFAGYRRNSAGVIDGFWMWEQNVPNSPAIRKGFYSISSSGVSDADNYYLVSV